MMPVLRDPPPARARAQPQPAPTPPAPAPATHASRPLGPAPTATNPAAAAAASASASAAAASFSSSSGWPRPERDSKNLLHFRIPMEVGGSAAAKLRASSPHQNRDRDRDRERERTNATPAAPASSAADGIRRASASNGSWAAALAASVQPAHPLPTSRGSPSPTPAVPAPALQPVSVTPAPSPAVVAPAASSSAVLPASVSAAASASSPLPNAWLRSDKPSWSSAQPVQAHKKKTTTTIAAPASSAHATPPAHSSSSGSSTGQSASAHATPIPGSAEPVATSAQPQKSSHVSGGGSTSSSRSSSRSKSASTHAQASGGGVERSVGSKGSSSLSVAATPATSSGKKATEKGGRSAATPTANSEESATPQAADSASATEAASPSLPVSAAAADAAAPAAPSPPPNSCLPTVVESTMSRTTSEDAQGVAHMDTAQAAPAVAAPPPAPLPAASDTESTTPASQPPASVDASLQSSPVLVPLPTPPESDQLAPLPTPGPVPTLSLTRRSAGVSNSLSSHASSTVSSSAELTRRLWSHLLDNLSRTTNELFYLCSMHMSSTQAARCRQVLYHLQSSSKDFTKLLAHAEQKTARKMSTGTTVASTTTSSSSSSSSSSSKLDASSSAPSSSSASKPLTRSRKSTSSSLASSSLSSSSSTSASKSSKPPASPSSSLARPSRSTQAADSEEGATTATSAKRASSKSASLKGTTGGSKKKSAPAVAISSPPAEAQPSEASDAALAEPTPAPPASSQLTYGEGTLFGLLGLTGRSLTSSAPVPHTDSTAASQIPQPPAQAPAPSSQPDAPHTPPHSRLARSIAPHVGATAATHPPHASSPMHSRIPTLHTTPARPSGGADSSAPSSASKWNATSALLESGSATVDEAAEGKAAAVAVDSSKESSKDVAAPASSPATSSAPSATTPPADVPASSSSRPPVPKSAWTSQTQTQQMLSSHKSNAAAAKPLVSTLSTRSPAFKPMQIVVASDNTSAPAVPLVPAAAQPSTPPSSQKRANTLDHEQLPPTAASSTPIPGMLREQEMSPLQQRLSSPERLQARLRLPLAIPSALDADGATSARATAASDVSRDATAAGDDQSDAAKLTQSLKASLDDKQEKAARNRSLQLESQRRKLIELNSTRLMDVEHRRETRLKVKGSVTDTRLAQAAEVYDTHLESKRRRAINENQKVQELAFLNATLAEERAYSLTQKQSDSDARVRMLQEKRLESIRGANLAKSSIIDERKRDAQEDPSKKQEKHHRIDQRLELAEARRLQGKNRHTRGAHSINASNGGSNAGTPSESPFQSPRPGTSGSNASFMAGINDAAAAAAAAEGTPQRRRNSHKGLALDADPASDGAAASAAVPAAEEPVVDLECFFCSLCKVKLYTDDYVRRHVAGKKHQALIADQLVKGLKSTGAAADESEPMAASQSHAAPGDGYIVSYSSLLTSASRRPQQAAAHGSAAIRFLAEPSLAAQSKSSRKNQKKKARKLRQTLSADSGEPSGAEEEEADAFSAAAPSDATAAGVRSTPRKEAHPLAADPSLEDVHSMPPTRLRTQSLSLLSLLERAEKSSGREGKSGEESSAPSSSAKQLLLVNETLEHDLQEELHHVLVRLDEELLVVKSDAAPATATEATEEEGAEIPTLSVMSPPGLKQLLASRLIHYVLSPTLSVPGSSFSPETVRLAAEVVYSCCKSSPMVGHTLLAKHRLIPLVDLAMRSLYHMHVHSTNAQHTNPPVLGAGGATVVSVHTPAPPPVYLEYVFLTLTVVLQERYDSDDGDESRPASQSAIPPSHRRQHLKHRQEIVRYIGLSEMLARIVQQFSHVDRYMTLVSAASISPASLAMAAQPPMQAPTEPVAASAKGPTPSKQSTARGGSAKDRLTAKLAAQKSATKTKDGAVAVKATPLAAPPSAAAMAVPIHTPVVPHASFILCLANFLDALTTMPADAEPAPSHLAAASPTKKKPAHGVYNYALVRALKDTVCAGLLSLIGSITLSHWIIPTKAPVQLPSPQSSASAVAPATPSLSFRDKANSTILSQESAGILVSAFRVFRNLATHDLPLLQDWSESFQPHLFGILTFLIAYCMQHMPKGNVSSGSSSSNIHTTLLELLVPLVGSIALLCPNNQKMTNCWRDGVDSNQEECEGEQQGGAATDADAPPLPPTLLQQLCRLPLHFYTDARLQQLLFPTLLACSYDPTNATAKSVLATELPPAALQQLQAWLDNTHGAAPPILAPVAAQPATDAAAATATPDESSDAPVVQPRSASTLRSSPPLSPLDKSASGGQVRKIRASSAACASPPPGEMTDATSSSSSSAATTVLGPVHQKGKGKGKAVKSLVNSLPAKSKDAGKDAAALASPTAAMTAGKAPATRTTGKGASASAALTPTPMNEEKKEATAATAGDDTATAPAETAAAAAEAPTPVPSPSVSLPPADAPSSSFQSLPARADVSRRFPPELFKTARAQLFD